MSTGSEIAKSEVKASKVNPNECGTAIDIFVRRPQAQAAGYHNRLVWGDHSDTFFVEVFWHNTLCAPTHQPSFFTFSPASTTLPQFVISPSRPRRAEEERKSWSGDVGDCTFFRSV